MIEGSTEPVVNAVPRRHILLAQRATEDIAMPAFASHH